MNIETKEKKAEAFVPQRVEVFSPALSDVTRIAVQRGMVTVNLGERAAEEESSLSDRGEITGFSRSSRQRMAKFLRNSVIPLPFMVTLTYPSVFPSDGKTVKYHLKRFCQEYVSNIESSGVATDLITAFWFLEFQARGAPHFHLFVSHPIDYKWVAKSWYRIVGTDDIRHLHAGTKIEKLRDFRAGAISYAKKYAEKSNQKQIPPEYAHAGRFWGVVGNRATVAAAIARNRDCKFSENIEDRITWEKAMEQLKYAIMAGVASVIKIRNSYVVMYRDSPEQIECRVIRWKLLISYLASRECSLFAYELANLDDIPPEGVDVPDA